MAARLGVAATTSPPICRAIGAQQGLKLVRTKAAVEFLPLITSNSLLQTKENRQERFPIHPESGGFARRRHAHAVRYSTEHCTAPGFLDTALFTLRRPESTLAGRNVSTSLRQSAREFTEYCRLEFVVC